MVETESEGNKLFFFQLLMEPVGHAGGYRSEISHLAHWYSSNQMSNR